MRHVNNRLQQMPRSGIRVIMDLANQQDEVFHLELGEPGFDTPKHIQEAGMEAMLRGFTKYTPNIGLLSLRELIVDKLNRENDIQVDVEQVAVTPGAIFGVVSALSTIAEQGDEILIPDPGWPHYTMQCLILGLVPKYYKLPRNNRFEPDVAEVESLITPKTRGIVLNSPGNPTGAVISPGIIEALLTVAKRHDVYLISDEIYERIVFEGAAFSPASLDPDGNVIVINGFSKTYAMTGWRVGYWTAPKEIILPMRKVLEPFVTSACSISQKAAEMALSGDQTCVAKMVAIYRTNRDVVAAELERQGLCFSMPQGAFYLLVDISATGMDSYSYAQKLVKATGVAVAPGKTFGPSSDHLVRISFCAGEAELSEGISRFCRFFKEQA